MLENISHQIKLGSQEFAVVFGEEYLDRRSLTTATIKGLTKVINSRRQGRIENELDEEGDSDDKID